MAGMPGMPGTPGMAGVAGMAGMAGMAGPPPQDPDRVYAGTIKSYNPDKGWGHINCPETRQMVGKDIFLLRSQLNGVVVSPGDKVRFRLKFGHYGGPEAVDVRILSDRLGSG